MLQTFICGSCGKLVENVGFCSIWYLYGQRFCSQECQIAALPARAQVQAQAAIARREREIAEIFEELAVKNS